MQNLERSLIGQRVSNNFSTSELGCLSLDVILNVGGLAVLSLQCRG